MAEDRATVRENRASPFEGPGAAPTPSSDSVLRKVTWRILPLLMLSYFAAYLDRVNVSFAAASLHRDLAISATVFGFGAGMFFLGYVLFELPSNLALQRYGARRWFTRIMVSWGVVSLLFAFVWNGTSFVALRFLLGAAEAGLFPGVVLYLCGWFPAVYRARVLAAFAVALPASTAIGAPISGAIVNLDGAMGLHGWQWLFGLEAIPSLIMGLVVYLHLPSTAAWLDEGERDWLVAVIEGERAPDVKHDGGALRAALRDPRIWLLGIVYAAIVASNYGISFWLPQIVGGFGLSSTAVGFLSGLPYAVGAVGMIWWGRRSDRRRERLWHVVVPSLIAAAAIAASALTGSLTLKMAALTVAGFGAFAGLPVFWSLPATFLSQKRAAVGIAVISSLGNIAGFVAPFVMGAFKDATGGFGAGLIALAAFVLAGVLVMLPLSRRAAWDPGVIAASAKESSSWP